MVNPECKATNQCNSLSGLYMFYRDDILPVQKKMQNNVLLLKLINMLFPEHHSVTDLETVMDWQKCTVPSG